MRSKIELTSNKFCKSRAYDMKVSFKNTRETAASIKGMDLQRAKQYLENVCRYREIVPFRRYRYGIGRKSQLKVKKHTSGRWPVKSSKFLLEILKNAESNASLKGLDLTSLYIKNIQVNKAIRGNRRTFRAYGKVNAFLSHPCHVEVWLVEKFKPIQKSYSII